MFYIFMYILIQKIFYGVLQSLVKEKQNQDTGLLWNVEKASEIDRK